MMGASLTLQPFRPRPPGSIALPPAKAQDAAMDISWSLLAWLGLLALIGLAPKELAQIGLLAGWLLLLGAAGFALGRLLF